MKIFKMIIHLLAHISYFLIIVYVAICIPILFGQKPMVVLSDSMKPVFTKGCLVYYDSKANISKLKVDDIISFKLNNDKVVSHRVYEIKDDIILTKGDNNASVDPFTINRSQVLGTIDKYYIPYIGYYIAFVNSHYYLLILVFIILFLEFLFTNIKAKDKIDILLEKESI